MSVGELVRQPVIQAGAAFVVAAAASAGPALAAIAVVDPTSDDIGVLQLIAAVVAVVAATGAAITTYVKASKEAEGSRTAVELDRRQRELAAILWAAADSHEAVMACVFDGQRDVGQASGRATQVLVDAAAQLVRLWVDDDTQLRAAFVVFADSRWTVVAATGPTMQWSRPAGSDFDVAAQTLMATPDAWVNEPARHNPSLALPGEAGVVVRFPVATGADPHGLLCIDVWRKDPLGETEEFAIHAISNLLAATLSAAELAR